MMSEYTENVGHRAELRQRRLRIVAQAEALRDSLRRMLPVAEEVEALDGEALLSTALALNQTLIELTALDKKLAVLNSVLGE